MSEHIHEDSFFCGGAVVNERHDFGISRCLSVREEHKKQTQVTIENGYINVAMLTGDKKPVEIEQAGKQLTLEDNSAPANSTGEVYPDVEEEVSDGEPVMGEC